LNSFIVFEDPRKTNPDNEKQKKDKESRQEIIQDRKCGMHS